MVTLGLIIVGICAGGFFGTRIILKDSSGVHSIHEAASFVGSKKEGTNIAKFSYPCDEIPSGSVQYYKEINYN